MDEAAQFVRSAASAGLPVLGVCFGHQLVGAAYGGQVRVNPLGWEVGTVDVALTDAGRGDPLFADLPPTLSVNQSHRDEVAVLGPDTRQLATGAQTMNQAIAVGEHVRGVQFHPEMDAGVVRNIIEYRRKILEADAAARPGSRSIDERERGTRDTPDAEAVLRNFLRHFVARA
jgi:GMP synthase (glutamine-hydrolysing)